MEGIDQNVLQFGVMNAMRTGNLVVDMAMCMFIPAIFGRFVQAIQWITQKMDFYAFWISYIQRNYHRTVEFEESLKGSWWGDDDETKNRNQLLQKAIKLYLTSEKGYAKDHGK
eukprot:gene15886-4798_t